MSLMEEILQYPKKFVAEDQLQQLLQELDYESFSRKVKELVEAGVLAPVKTSGLNGRYPPLFSKYRIIKAQHNYTEYVDAIRRLHPSLNITGYLRRPEVYAKHLEIITGLSNYLWHYRELLDKPMARKERSFSIWGREKLLDEHTALIREVLKFNGLHEDFLNYYDTPEPFFEYVHKRSGSMTVLIIENKDTWFTFRKLMQDTGKNTIASTAFDVLLYGEGNKITKRGALEEYKVGMLGGQSGQACCFLYFGDLDLEGIRLFFRARSANPALDLKPFAPLYCLMLELAETRELPDSPDRRGVGAPLPEFLAFLGLPREDVLTTLLADGKYIPQEIINYQVAAKILS